jgi:outer membrane usher protein FimD/PapC
MKPTLLVTGFTACALLVVFSGVPAHAHHSIAAQFDMYKTNTVSGTITKMDFRNPHSWLYVDVKDDKGQVQSWSIEFAAANALYRRGWRQEDLPVGAALTVTGYVARDGSRMLGATDVKLSDGRTLFAGTAPADGR